MKALLIVFTFTVLLLYTGSSASAEIVTISAQLPGIQASYVHCWAAATSSTNKHVPFPCIPGTTVCGKTDTSGANITCDANKAGGGNSATAHSRARVTGGVLLEATVSASKVSFAAAAAYAQGGGQVKKQGVNKSSLMFVEIDKLKVSGRQDPVDDEVVLEVNNLEHKKINYALIQRVVRDKELLEQILKDIDKSVFKQTDQSTSYLQVQAKFTAEKELVVTASAPLLCDTEKIKDAGVDVRNLSSPKDEVAVKNILDNFENFCRPQKNFVQTSSFEVKSSKDNNGQDVHVANLKKLGFVIVIPDNSKSPEGNDFSVNTVQFTSSRREGQQPSSQ